MPPLVITAPATPPNAAPPTVLFWRWLMLSHDEQPAMVTASAVAAQILVMDAIFMMGLLFLFPEKRWILLVASARFPLGLEPSGSQNIRLRAVKFAQELCQTAR